MSEAERKTFADLQWDEIERAVAERCVGPLRRRLRLPLADSFGETERALAESREAWSLLAQGDPIPLSGACELGPALSHLEREGVLEGLALRDLRDTLRSAATLRRFLNQRKGIVPYLQRACATDPTLDQLEEEIDRSIDDEGALVDSASQDLASLRGEVTNLRGRIVRKLEELVRKRSAILQDSFYTIREGRYVLPVRADAHERLNGIVHGSSASGATIFVEPRELVDRGNRLKMAQAELEREERRILIALSDLVRPSTAQLREVVRAIDHADLRAASARLAEDFKGCFAELTEQPQLDLRSSRHPLLALGSASVVPNSVRLQGGEALVISGPNAGGKTVVLKTLGLSALMTRAGLPIAAEEGSVCGFFAPVLASVGDEQSLERSLSTFSAHLVTLKSVLGQAGERVLVLLDELAGATDPEAGAALACAVVKSLVASKAAVAVTTHYEALKALAAQRDDMHNAAVGFDFDAMEPTFHLSMGVPGGSSALDVATRYGLPQTVIDDARTILPEQARTFDTLVSKLESARREVISELESMRREREALGAQRAELEQRRARLDAQEARTLSQESARLVEQTRRVQNELEQARRALRERADQEALSASRSALVESRDLLGAMEERSLLLQPDPVVTDSLDPETLAVGDRVWVKRLRTAADVLEPPTRGKVRVSAGMMKLWVDSTELRGLKPSTRRAAPKLAVAHSAAPRKRAVRTQDNTLDVRGLRADDARALAIAFLDRMYGAAEGQAFILHGVGSGALREAIHTLLSEDSSYVTDFRLGTPEEGGQQITVVFLK